MARKIRSDCRVGNAEKKYGLPAGSLRNPSGRDARSDKKIGNLRKDWDKATNNRLRRNNDDQISKY